MKILTTKISGNEICQFTEQEVFDSPREVNSSWAEKFKIIIEKPEQKIVGLRNPQIGAYYSILSHWTHTSKIGTVVLPTGTGKTETMLSLLISEELEKLLVIVPTDPLRTQISKKFITLGLLPQFRLVSEDIKYPIVGILKTKFKGLAELKDFLNRCNVIVATANILARLNTDEKNEISNSISHIFIDEAHHSEAQSWSKFRKHLENKRIIQFTATPFRNDNKRIDGKIIYSYPLKKAQQEGYFKPINFQKIYEYVTPEKDKALALKGIEQLRKDKQTYKHILLARVATTKRAEEVYEIYNQYKNEFTVVRIHSSLGARERKEIHNKIVNQEADIIVCVDMLGEGFDLPNLKIAVFHDIRQSLPITLQFVGRFTRTKYDEELGSATIIANLADIEVNHELDELYARDPDWNEILPLLSETKTQKEIEIYNTIQGFNDNENFPVTIQSLKPALSTVVFINHTNEWFPTNFKKGLSNIDSYELVRHNLNPEEKILIILTAKKIQADWINNENITDLLWNFYVVFWETRKNLLYIHSSDTSSLHIELAKSIIGDKAEIINGDNGGRIFRVLSGINRFKLQNVGLTEIVGKLIRFIMRVGSDIEPALSKAAINRAKKAMIFGTGYENGEDVSIGCSYKGRVWSRKKNDIPTLIKWFKKVGDKILDERIDADEVLKGALVAKAISERPNIYPYFMDWNEDVYKQSEIKYSFVINNRLYELYNLDLCLINPSNVGNIVFGLKQDEKILIELELVIFNDANNNSNFRIEKKDKSLDALVKIGNTIFTIEEYFYKETPSIWFANGDYLEGNNLIEIKNIIEPYDSNTIESWDWTGVDLNQESQDCNPKKTGSIQYKVLEILKHKDYDIIFDDDGSGEIADILTFKVTETEISVELYHIKFALGGEPSKQIKNLYEVCGQAQKSINWKFKRGKEFIEHLLRRESIRKQKGLESRIEKGSEEDLIQLLDLVNNKFPLEFKIFIVQPGLSKTNHTTQQLSLLGVTENYLLERALTKLNVIANS